MTHWQGRIPLLVGVTGHRDLEPGQRAEIERQLRLFFAGLRSGLPSTPIVVLSQLAEGADQLAATVALEEGCESACVLPLELALYRSRFRGDAARADFDRLLARGVVLELPEVGAIGEERWRGYAAAGNFIARHATMLLALWDGAPSDRPGSTADVVRVRCSSWLAPGGPAAYHVPVARAGATPGAAPPEGVAPLAHAREALRAGGCKGTDEFNSAVLGTLGGIGVPPPFDAIQDARLADAAATFAAAKTLAVDAQRALTRRKLLLQTLACLAAIAFVAIFKAGGLRWLVWIYLALLAGIWGLRRRMRRDALHRHHLDYRCLAEGLRVLLYWRVAGVHGDESAHASSLQRVSHQDASLRWIGSALAGLDGWIGRMPLALGFDGIDFAAQHWLGRSAADRGAQIAYYRGAAGERRRAAATLDRIVSLTLACGIATAAALAVLPASLLGHAAGLLMAIMGFLPLVSGTASEILDVPAELEVARQYESMADMLAYAAKRLRLAGSDDERRRLLLEAGMAAIAEHRIWHTVFRERAPEDGRRG